MTERKHEGGGLGSSEEGAAVATNAALGVFFAPWLAGPAMFLVGVAGVLALSRPETPKLVKAGICAAFAFLYWKVAPTLYYGLVGDVPTGEVDLGKYFLIGAIALAIGAVINFAAGVVEEFRAPTQDPK